MDNVSAQNLLGMLQSIKHVISTTVLFVLYAAPFCSGELGKESSCLIPSCFKYSSNCLNLYSPPWSERRILTLLACCSYTIFFHFLNFASMQHFLCRKCAQQYLVLSSMKVRKYSAPLRDLLFIFLQTSL